MLSNRRGRPSKWFFPLRHVYIPDKYADKVLQLCYEWQQAELQILSEFKHK